MTVLFRLQMNTIELASLSAYGSAMSGMAGGPASKDLEHLRLLVVFHYIVGAITAIWLSFPLIHVFIGLMFMLNPRFFGVGLRMKSC